MCGPVSLRNIYVLYSGTEQIRRDLILATGVWEYLSILVVILDIGYYFVFEWRRNAMPKMNC